MQLWLLPYLFGLLTVYLLRFAPLVVDNFVLRHEHSAANRRIIEQSCLYAVAATTLVSISVSSWLVALCKVGEIVGTTRNDEAIWLFVTAVIIYGMMLSAIVRYLRKVTPHDFSTKNGGLVGLTVRDSIRALQAICVMLGLAVDGISRFIR